MSSASPLLKTLLSQYGDSLIRVDSEKEHQTSIVERAKAECGVSGQHFKKLAVALHKDRVQREREDLQGQIDLFNAVMGCDE